MYAAVAPELGGCGFAYLQDCAVTRQWPAVRSAALARRLYEASEAAIAAALQRCRTGNDDEGKL